ncbi:MAG: hypothetical protein M1830_005866, partial [Pleopsidium flavum]
MSPLQSAHSRSPSKNLPENELEHLSSIDNATSQPVHHLPEDAPVREPYLSLGYRPQLHAKELSELQESHITGPSVASNAPHLNATSSTNSQSTIYTDLTPPTTSSGPSSQGQHSQFAQRPQADSSTRNTTIWAQDRTIGLVDLNGKPSALSVHTTPTSPASSTFPAEILNHGQKRTASGAVKQASTSLPASPVEVVGRSHSRNTSMNSSGSQIGELSSQLRTRLSYAMVKVQNGWQDHSLDEVESLASQQASPISNPSVLHGTRRIEQSPGVSMAASRRERSGFSQSPERNADATRPRYHAEHGDVANSPGVLINPYHANMNKPISTLTNEAPTYESFWRQHSVKPTTRHAQTHSSNSSGPSLEPSADIVSRSSRRSNLQQLQPPLYTNNLSNLSASSEASARSFVPATPPPQKRVTAMRTPSQNAAMEKDAVETLLFMSSPVNSGYLPQ